MALNASMTCVMCCKPPLQSSIAWHHKNHPTQQPVDCMTQQMKNQFVILKCHTALPQICGVLLSLTWPLFLQDWKGRCEQQMVSLHLKWNKNFHMICLLQKTQHSLKQCLIIHSTSQKPAECFLRMRWSQVWPRVCCLCCWPQESAQRSNKESQGQNEAHRNHLREGKRCSDSDWLNPRKLLWSNRSIMEQGINACPKGRTHTEGIGSQTMKQKLECTAQLAQCDKRQRNGWQKLTIFDDCIIGVWNISMQMTQHWDAVILMTHNAPCNVIWGEHAAWDFPWKHFQ